MRAAIALVLALALGFAGGFIAGRLTAPSNLTEQTALFDGPLELVERRPGTDHRGRKHNLRFVEHAAHLGQNFSPTYQRLLYETTPSMVKEIEQNIPHRAP